MFKVQVVISKEADNLLWSRSVTPQFLGGEELPDGRVIVDLSVDTLQKLLSTADKTKDGSLNDVIKRICNPH